MERLFEIVDASSSRDKLTVTPDRVTLKLGVSTTQMRRARLIAFARLVARDVEVGQSFRGHFHRDIVDEVTLYSGSKDMRLRLVRAGDSCIAELTIAGDDERQLSLFGR